MTAEVWTVGRLLTWTTEWLGGKGSESPRLDAEVLLAHVRGCPRIALYTAFARKGANMVQINDYNRSQLTCRGVMAPSGEPSVMYAVLLNGRQTRDEMREHIGVWQGCLSGFGEFIQDPIGFLSRPQG